MGSMVMNLIGSWDLVHWYREREDGTREKNGGEHPRGRLTYTEDGFVHAILISDGRPHPDNVEISDSDKIQLFKTVMAYSGTYRLENNKVVHAVDLSWNELWSGTLLIRYVELEGDWLRVKTSPVRDLYDGTVNIYVVEWVRSKAPFRV